VLTINNTGQSVLGHIWWRRNDRDNKHLCRFFFLFFLFFSYKTELRLCKFSNTCL